MYKERLLTNLFNMALWYGIFSLVLDALQLSPIPFVIVGIAAFMAWARR